MLSGIALSSAIPSAFSPAFGSQLGKTSIKNQVVPDLSGKTPRIVLGDGHLLIALALMLDDPISPVVGWQGDLVRHSKELYDAYRVQKPEIADIPLVGDVSAQSFSIERALSLNPDVLILAGGYGPGPLDHHVVDKFKAAGIPVVFVDFHKDGLRNTAPCLRILGKMFGKEAQQRANRYADLHESRIQTIREKIEGQVVKRPRVLLEANAAMPSMGCCWVPGGNGLGEFIQTAGGINIGTDLAPEREWLKADQEHMLTSEPDVYIATGGPYLRGKSGLTIGPGATKEESQRTLFQTIAASETGISSSLQNNRFHGIWHLFHAIPVNLLVLEAMAEWFHPEIFEHDAEKLTIERLNNEFLTLPLNGHFTVSLPT